MAPFNSENYVDIRCDSTRLTLRSRTLTPREMLNQAMGVLAERTDELSYTAKAKLEPLVVERCPKKAYKGDTDVGTMKILLEPEPCDPECQHTFVKSVGVPSVHGELVQGSKVIYDVKQAMNTGFEGRVGNEYANSVHITPAADAPEGVLLSIRDLL